MKTKEKSLETLAVLNIFFLIGFLYFEKKNILRVDIIFTVVCLMFPTLLKLIHLIWTRIFSLLGEINSKILLGLIYFIFLVPISTLQKVFTRKKNKIAEDNYISREHIFCAKDFETMG